MVFWISLLSLGWASPVELTHQARVLDALGAPIEAPGAGVRASLWTASVGGTEVWAETHTGVPVNDGYVSLVIGSESTLDSSVLDADSLWLELSLDGGTPLGRARLRDVPSAVRARTADSATSVVGGVVNASEVQVNGTPVINASGQLTASQVAGDLAVEGTLSSSQTWGISARTQGLMAMPEGDVYQDGANVVFSGDVMVMNSAAGSYIRAAAGTYTLPDWGYLYIDLPPTGSRGATVTPSIGSWTDGDRDYDGPDRFVLAQRRSAGLIYLNMAVPAHAMTASSRLITRLMDLPDERNNVSKSAAQQWWQVPGRTLPFTKRYSDSLLQVTYQDTFGTLGTVYDGCDWQIRVDGAALLTFSAADHDRGIGEVNDWTMAASTQTAWSSGLSAGDHTITVYNRGDRSAWSSDGGTQECLMGWNTDGNFIAVEEIP